MKRKRTSAAKQTNPTRSRHRDRRGFTDIKTPGAKTTRTTERTKTYFGKMNVNACPSRKIRGKLGHSQSLRFGRYGRALMAEFPTRQYSRSVSTFHPITDELKRPTKWWMPALKCLTPRKYHLRPRQPILMYVDASGSGHIGAAAFVDGSKKSMRAHLPGRFLPGDGVYEFQMTAMISRLLTAVLLSPGRP